MTMMTTSTYQTKSDSEFRFSERTLEIIKNFSRINPAMVFYTGSQLRSFAGSEQILGFADIEETIPQTFAIFELSKFLDILSVYESPVIRFETDSAIITEMPISRKSYRYKFVNEDHVKTAPSKKLEMERVLTTFPLDAQSLMDLLKVGSIASLPDVAFVVNNGVLTLRAFDKNDKSRRQKDIYEEEIAPETGNPNMEIHLCQGRFTPVLLNKNITTYTVTVGEKRGSCFITLDTNYKGLELSYTLLADETSEF